MLNTNKPFCLYVIESQCGRRYIGVSSDFEKRLEMHNSGQSRWTSGYKNWRLIYSEKFENYTEARKREIYLKRQKGGNGFLKIIQSGMEQSGSSRGS